MAVLFKHIGAIGREVTGATPSPGPFNDHPTLDTNLISYFKMENILDSKSVTTLTNTGATTTTGIISNAYDFASTYYMRASTHTVAPLDRDWSVGLWFKSTTTTVSPYMMSMMNNANSDWMRIYFLSDGKVSFSCDDGSNPLTVISTTSSYDNNNWHYVIVTRDMATNTWTMYIDNSLIGSSSDADSSVDSSDELLIGALWGNGGASATPKRNFFSGALDEIGFWSKVLSTQERSDLWNSGNGLTY